MQGGGRGGRGTTRGRGGGGGNRGGGRSNRGGGRGRKSEATKAALQAEKQKAAFLLKKYRAEGSRLAAQAALSTDEDVVCEGEKTREERDAELRARGGVCGQLRWLGSWQRGTAWVAGKAWEWDECRVV